MLALPSRRPELRPCWAQCSGDRQSQAGWAPRSRSRESRRWSRRSCARKEVRMRSRELEDPTEQRAGLRVLADAFDNPNAVGLVAVPVDLHPNFFLGGGLERRAEVAEAFEDPCLPADVEI